MTSGQHCLASLTIGQTYWPHNMVCNIPFTASAFAEAFANFKGSAKLLLIKEAMMMLYCKLHELSNRLKLT